MSEFSIGILCLFEDRHDIDKILKVIKKSWDFLALSISDFDVEEVSFTPSLVVLDLLENGTDAIMKQLAKSFPSASYLLILKEGYLKESLEAALRAAPLSRDFVLANCSDWELKQRFTTLLEQWLDYANPNKPHFDPNAPILATFGPTVRLIEQGDWLAIWADRNAWRDLNERWGMSLRKQFKNSKSGFTEAIGELERWANALPFADLVILAETSKKYQSE